MNRTALIAILAVCFFGLVTSPLRADCPLAHTHIGKNPTWRPDWSAPGDPGLATDSDPTDDNQLWFFSLPPVHAAATPGWPAWGGDPYAAPGTPFLKLVPDVGPMGEVYWKNNDPGSGKIRWTCEFHYSMAGGHNENHPNAVEHLDGWHSAHGPQGAWDLESFDESTEPAWDIGVKRESTSLADPTDFLMIRPTGVTPEVFVADGDTYKFSDYGEKQWMEDEQAWGIHSHMGFYFYLPDTVGQEVSVTFSAFDDGLMYTPSDAFEMRFVTVPEPMTLGLLVLGAVTTVRPRRSHS